MSAQEKHDISIRRLRKTFGQTEVLRGIDLDIPTGSFVGLMGPNGAGKSTLIKILGGVYQRSSGEIRYGDEPIRSLAERPEVGFLHQDLGLIEDLSIVDNLRLGERPLRLIGPIVHKQRERSDAARALERVRLDRPVDMLIRELSPGEKTLVAIARLLTRGANVLFIDEATSTLPPADAKRLMAVLTHMIAEENATVIIVSHKLSEILDATGRVIMLVDGAVAADLDASEFNREHVVSLLVDHERSVVPIQHHVKRQPGATLMRLSHVFGGRAGPVDLELRAGQVLGLTGLPGSGLHDVAHLVHGTIQPTRGHIERADSTRTAILPPHRETEGGFSELSVLDNLTISALDRWRAPWRLQRRRAEEHEGEAMIDRLKVKPPNCQERFSALSGGNKQKVIFGRVLLREPTVYVLCEPTRGVDISTRAEIYELIHALVDRDAAVLVVTSDSEDLFAVCDRIAVVVDGRVGAFLSADDTNPRDLEAFV